MPRKKSASNHSLAQEGFSCLKHLAADNLHKIRGSALKAYLWLLIRQEELARNTKGPGLEVSDSELAAGLDISKRTACDYREKLVKLRLVEATKVKGSKIGEIAITRPIY